MQLTTIFKHTHTIIRQLKQKHNIYMFKSAFLKYQIQLNSHIKHTININNTYVNHQQLLKRIKHIPNTIIINKKTH